MIKNILIGGAAGMGMDTLANFFASLLHKNGLHIFITQDYMSRIRGGHNFFLIRFGDEPMITHDEHLDGIIALDEHTVKTHESSLKSNGFIIADETLQIDTDGLSALPTTKIAKEIGNVRVAGSVALGALCKICGIDIEDMPSVFKEKFDERIAEQNIQAFTRGHELQSAHFSFKKDPAAQTWLIDTNEAIATSAIASNIRFYSSYPMTPASSIMKFLSDHAKDFPLVVEQAEDEIAAINMAIGASYAGIRAMTGTSGGGFALMVEAIGLTAMIEAPLVIALIQRPGPATGFPTRTEQGDLLFSIFGTPSEIPKMVIAVTDPQNAFEQTNRAFCLADEFQIPVILLGDQYLADNKRTVRPFNRDAICTERYIGSTRADTKDYARYADHESGVSERLIPGFTKHACVLVDSDEHDAYGRITEAADVRKPMHEKRLRKMDGLKTRLIQPQRIGPEQADTLLLTFGSLKGAVQQAVSILNEKKKDSCQALVFSDVWPLPDQLLRQCAAGAKNVISIEQNATAQFARLIKGELGIACHRHILRYDGRPMSADEIVRQVEEGV